MDPYSFDKLGPLLDRTYGGIPQGSVLELYFLILNTANVIFHGYPGRPYFYLPNSWKIVTYRQAWPILFVHK